MVGESASGKLHIHALGIEGGRKSDPSSPEPVTYKQKTFGLLYTNQKEPVGTALTAQSVKSGLETGRDKNR